MMNESDCGKSEEDNFTLSSDSTSTFEFIEGRSRVIAAWSSTPPPTKEEKQKLNEELVMESAASWERIEMSDIQKDDEDEGIEACRSFLANEKSYNDTEVSDRPSIPSKPCFIDASSLLDDDYMPISFAAARRESPKGYLSTAGYSGPSSFSQPEENHRRTPHEIKDQYSAIPTHFHIPKNLQQHSSLHDIVTNEERPQGHSFLNHDYLSDISSNYVPSEYSSESCGASGNFNNNNTVNTSGYSTNYSRYDGGSDSLQPETPYNSIVHLSKKLEICEIDGNDDDYHARTTSSPIPIKRITKCDESAAIVSGGASIIDFTPAKCDSPSVRRKTDTCPIVSGGSLDLPEEPKKMKSAGNRERSSFSWVVDIKNDLRIEEEVKEQKPATPKNSLGFYVDFGSLEATPEEKVIKKVARGEEMRKATGFYVDFSDSSCPNTPKQSRISSAPVEPRKIEIVPEAQPSDEKKSLFNMYIDMKDKQGSSKDSDETNDEGKNEDLSSSSSSKKGHFMFIESDPSPVVLRHRAKIAAKEPGKRHSWNVNQTPEYDAEMEGNSSKKYQRSTSVNIPDKELHIHEKSIINVPSKTSSLSIGSSLSPHEDFSCSKSLSSRSNLSISTSNTSIDQSETKVQEKLAVRKRRKEAKINETYDKSSQGSVTDEIFSNEESPTSSTDTDDITFQNQQFEGESESIHSKEATLIEDIKSKMDTIVERSEHSSPFKKAVDAPPTVDQQTNQMHTMESLQQLIEKQKQILENTADSTSISFVKLSDLDKPVPLSTAASQSSKKDFPFMTNSAGFRVSLLDNQGHQKGHQNMSRSTGNNFHNLASSVENSKSLSRLFPHLSKAFSSSVPSNVGLNPDLNMFEHVEYISSDFSCTSSINSSRSGMDSADESSISCRQPRRLGSDLLKMFLQEIGTDIVIDVNGKKIKAHKVILRSRCQYFAAMLAGKFTEASGNIISLPGYSYSVVHFALCHVYSGAAHVPPGLDLMELASLSDLLGLEGLKEVTGYALKTNYCHNFHKPCSGCIDGVLQVMPVTLYHGFDELYRKCVKWICKHFSKVWISKPFASLPCDLQLRCNQQICAHLSSENVLDWILDCEDVLKVLLISCRWDTTDVCNVINILLDSVRDYIMDHFASLIASDSFLSLGHDRKDMIPRLEHSILKAAAKLSPEQACKSYPRAVRLNTLLNAKLIKFPSPLSNESFKPFERIQLRDDDLSEEWNDEFIKLVSAMLCAVEQSLIRQCNKAIKCSSWQRIDVDLRSKIQKIACVTETDDSMSRRNLRSSVTSLGSVRSNSASSTTSRANDLRQVKLVIQAHSQKLKTDNQTITVLTNKTTKPKPQPPVQTHQPVLRDYKAGLQKLILQPRLSDQFKPLIQKQWNVNDRPHSTGSSDIKKFGSIKSRYMEPRKQRLDSSDLPQIKAASGKSGRMSSSEHSSRDTSPAFTKKKGSSDTKKLSNLSLDSLQSPAKQRLGNTKKDDDFKASSESLIRRNNLQNKLKVNQTSTNVQIQKSFLSQKSREILAKRSQQDARKLSTNSNSSVTTKSNKSSSPHMIPLNKSQSTSVVPSASKKVFSTTLHLRKSSRLPEPVTAKNERNKLQKSATQKIYPTTKKLSPPPQHPQKEKEKIKKKSLKSPVINVIVEVNSAKAIEDEVFESKMARSNTFSKEQPDNPIELLKTMN